MKRVTGIGGIFFTARDPAALRAWYADTSASTCRSGAERPSAGPTMPASRCRARPWWSIGETSGGLFAPGTAPFVVNYRVADLAALLQALRAGAATCSTRRRTRVRQVRLGHRPRGSQGRTLATARTGSERSRDAARPPGA